ncbi:hypothetical protein BDV28DRAFT_20982 [Aspergillus coremiiformis]|uniref:Uncharacterized protein n=1 Tax=Aspergillus coremiiformis TaxID=138285 RepID=A0A5N6Z5V4_9EURO|nr:hypothetical protein BDV28DRAFT_20982 [Aspergillus coremiiformis]
MSTLKIPPVTIEDLQAFQAKHFPGSGQTLVSEYTCYENVTDEFADDDDDLGYYPDGVKRTLTDEQIRIFRHSEVHSLLRERQLREEELAQSSSESEGDEENNGDSIVKRPGATVGETDQSTRESQGARTRQSDSRQSMAKKHTEDKSSNPTLDYDEDATGDISHKPVASGYIPQLPGRRIVSYED